MANISSSDFIFATLMHNGDVIANLHATGFSSLHDIMVALRNKTTGITGLTTLNVRNPSQGWSATRPIFLR